MEMVRVPLWIPCQAITRRSFARLRNANRANYRAICSFNLLTALPQNILANPGLKLNIYTSAFSHRMQCMNPDKTQINIQQEREILVQHLLVKEDQLNLLTELQKRLITEDIDLSDLATEYSICPSKKDGGMLGWVTKGRMVPEFEEAAFTAPLNKVVRVKTKFGWHLLQVLSERQAGFLVEIKPEDLFEKMKEPDFKEKAQLMDVREPNEIEKASLDGFKPYPLSQFGKWGPTVTETLNPEKETYVLCHHGVRSLQAAQWLKTQGFKQLHNVSGGIHAYSEVDETVPVY